MVVSVTDDTVTLSWMEPDPTNGIIIEYRLQYWRCSQSSRNVEQDITALTHTVGGLIANTEYCFRARAVTRVGGGEFTEFVIATTCESCICQHLRFILFCSWTSQ